MNKEILFNNFVIGDWIKHFPELLDFCDFLPGDYAYLKVWFPKDNIHYGDKVKILKIVYVAPEHNLVDYQVEHVKTGTLLDIEQSKLSKEPLK